MIFPDKIEFREDTDEAILSLLECEIRSLGSHNCYIKGNGYSSVLPSYVLSNGLITNSHNSKFDYSTITKTLVCFGDSILYRDRERVVNAIRYIISDGKPLLVLSLGSNNDDAHLSFIEVNEFPKYCTSDMTLEEIF